MSTPLPTSAPEPSPARPLGPLAHVKGFVARHHVALLLALGALMNVWVLLSVRWFPAQDLGGHIELMDIMARADDPATIYPEMYQTSSPLTANGLSLLLATLLGGVMSVVTIAKLMLVFYAAALPFSVASMARAFGRPPWLALFACPLVFSTALALGFINFVVALPMLFWSVALARRYAERGGWRLALGLTLLMTTTFLAHIIAYMITAGIVAFVIYVHLPTLRRAARLAPVVLSSPLFVIWVWQRLVANTANTSGRTFLGPNEGLGAMFRPLDERLDMLRSNVFQFLRNSADEVVLVVLVLAWLFLVAHAMRASRAHAHHDDDGATATPTPAGGPDAPPARGVRAWLRSHALEVILGGCFVAYFTLPNNVREVDIIAERAWYVGVFFLAVLPRVASARAVAWVLVVLSGVSIAYPIAVQRIAQRYDEEVVGDLPEAIAALPDKTALACFTAVREPEGFYHGIQWHLGKALHATLNGGYTDDNFAIRPYFPVDFRPGKAPIALDPRFWSDPRLYDWDHVLLYQPTEPTGALRSKRLSLRWHGGAWWLFDVHVPAGWRTPMAGGRGGVEQVDVCRRGAAATGLEVTFDAGAVTSAMLLCGADAHAKRRGAEVGERQRLACPEGQTLVGVHGRADQMVRALGPRCRSEGGAVVDVPAAGPALGEPFALGCPAGEAPLGLKTRSGAAIDAVGVTCAGDGAAPPAGAPED